MEKRELGNNVLQQAAFTGLGPPPLCSKRLGVPPYQSTTVTTRTWLCTHLPSAAEPGLYEG